jgi:hypothetical protein
MLRRRTQNVYSNDNIGKKNGNGGSMVSLKNGHQASNFNSFEDFQGLKQANKPTNKLSQANVEQRRHIEFSDSDYQVYNASGANGRSQFFQSPGIGCFNKGEGSLPFIKKLDQKDVQLMKKINE